MPRIPKSVKAKEIGEILDDLYPKTPIPLEHMDSYTLLVAVILSAQCTDVRVNKITPLLFDRAATPYEMVQMRVEDIESIIRPCGLFQSKAKNIHAMSGILMEKYQGNVPDTLEELEELPGVGRKTASVVLVQAFGKSAFPVDTHIHRLAWRWGLSTGKNVRKTEEDLRRAFPEEEWDRRHLQMIFFGREYCPARGHDPNKCPICQKYGRKELFKQLGKKRAERK